MSGFDFGELLVREKQHGEGHVKIQTACVCLAAGILPQLVSRGTHNMNVCGMQAVNQAQTRTESQDTARLITGN